MDSIFPEIYSIKEEVPEIIIEKNLIEENNNTQWLYDFKKFSFIRKKDNSFTKIDKFASIQKWIEKIVLTSKGVWDIYEGTEYGSDFLNIITSNYDDDFKVIMLNKECKKVFTSHPEIKKVEDVIVYSTPSNECLITFKLILISNEYFEGQITL